MTEARIRVLKGKVVRKRNRKQRGVYIDFQPHDLLE